MSIDISKLNEKELRKLRDSVEKALAGFVKKKKAEARKAAETAAKKHGFSLNDLLGGARSGAKKSASVAKYANPANPAQTWSGRGRQPGWFKDAVSKGTDPSKLEI